MVVLSRLEECDFTNRVEFLEYFGSAPGARSYRVMVGTSGTTGRSRKRLRFGHGARAAFCEIEGPGTRYAVAVRRSGVESSSLLSMVTDSGGPVASRSTSAWMRPSATAVCKRAVKAEVKPSCRWSSMCCRKSYHSSASMIARSVALGSMFSGSHAPGTENPRHARLVRPTVHMERRAWFRGNGRYTRHCLSLAPSGGE